MLVQTRSRPDVPGKPTMGQRFVIVLRRIASAGIAGAIAGIVVGGLGGRIVMRVAAVLNPGATGLRTDNGELIGAVTMNGTLALLLFGGLASGLVAAIVWVVVSPWQPRTGLRRSTAAALAAVALGGPFVARSDNTDFRVLESDGVILVLLLGLVALLGLSIAWLDARLDQWLPRPTHQPAILAVAYGAVTVAGALILPIAIGFYLAPETCGCANPPRYVGWALVLVGGATVAGWAAWVGAGRSDPSPMLLVLGRVALLAALSLGTVRVVDELTRILGAA